jgi:hypothetical protein
MADQTLRNESITFLPEYQEKFSKDLLSNVYRIDPATGKPAGIAATSPLMGKPVVDAQGKPVYEIDPATGKPRLDMRGQPIQQVQGGVPKPDVVPLTDLQKRGIELGVQGIGAYGPMLQASEQTLGKGVASVQGSLGQYDPSMYKPYYDPYVEQVIDTTTRDINRQSDIERNRIGDAAVQSGAFGGSRQAVAEPELARATQDRQARMGAELRSAAYTGAQQQAQGVFENAMTRGQNAGQLFQGLGTAQGALGEAAQGAAGRDVSSLLSLGQMEQGQRQAEYDVQRAAGIEAAYEPFQRFSYMSDILQGVPSSSSTLSVASVPTPSPISSTLGTAMGLNAYQQQYGGLGYLLNRGGA